METNCLKNEKFGEWVNTMTDKHGFLAEQYKIHRKLLSRCCVIAV